MGRRKHGRGGGNRGRGYYEEGRGKGRGGGRGVVQMGSSSTNQPPLQSPQQRPSGRGGGAWVTQPGGGTASPRPQQQQGSDVPSTDPPPLQQKHDSDVLNTDWPELEKSQGRGVPSSVLARSPLQHGSGSGGVGTVGTPPSPLQQPQQLGSGSGVGTVGARPPPLQQPQQPVGGTASPRPQQQQGTDVPSTDPPPLQQQQDIDVLNTAWPTPEKSPGRGVPSSVLARSPIQHGSGSGGVGTVGAPPSPLQLPQQLGSGSGVGTVGAWPPPLQQPQQPGGGTASPRPQQQQGSGGGVGSAWDRPLKLQQPQQQGSGSGVGSAWDRPLKLQQPQQQGSGIGVGNAWARPLTFRQPQEQGSGNRVGIARVRPPPQQHGGGNQQKQAVDRRRTPPQSSDGPVGKLINMKDPKNSNRDHLPMPRPDTGNDSGKRIWLFADYFPVTFNSGNSICHYDVDVKRKDDEHQPGETVKNKSELRWIREKLVKDGAAGINFSTTAYDGSKNIYSAARLEDKCFTVNFFSEGNGAKVSTYEITIKLVADLQLSNLNDMRNISVIPREILQGMDVVMKENPRRSSISVGRCFYSYENYKDLGCGAAAHIGFQQSLKPTSKGLALCLDYSALLAIPTQIPVIEFLKKYYYGETIEDIFQRRSQAASNLLAGLKVKVTHRPNKQKFVIKKLIAGETSALTFNKITGDTIEKVRLVDYFKDTYKKDIKFKHLPTLDIGKPDKENYVPVEFCELIAGQRFPKERLTHNAMSLWNKRSLPDPLSRRETIRNTVQATDGPCGDFTSNFEISVDGNMTSFWGRILPAPVLKIGGKRSPKINDKCQWNLNRGSVVEGKEIHRWALIDFSSSLHVDHFVSKLIDRCRKWSINMEEPAVKHVSDMNELSGVDKVKDLLKLVVDAADPKKGKLQMIVCVMASKHKGYKYLKWVSETDIGIVTQCCLYSNAQKGQDQFIANLCLKINAKLGGSNMELMETLPNFGSEDNVMFIGADVNHPAASNVTCPSIAAVVATINWPAANKYAAKVHAQGHRTEKIEYFGKMGKELVKTYDRLNSVKPNRIVVFRDGVSESQFGMVLNQELIDFAEAIYTDDYRPAITLVVAQKRHNTRLFRGDTTDGNVPSGTVVDTDIVHPSGFDFYLCSHYGGLGTSKPTHYHVLLDENGFNSGQLQQLIYNMCFTFARCTKSVSLVPPVYYADLVAYRGRMFQEVLMEKETSSSSYASFEENFYNLHSDLQDTMFFV